MTTRNLISRIGLGALTLCASLAALAQQSFAPQGLRVDQIRDDVYVISNSMSGNVTVLVTDEGVLLVDDKFENDHDAIMARVREITDLPIVYVVNTHFHGDHTGGNVRMQSLGARIGWSDFLLERGLDGIIAEMSY